MTNWTHLRTLPLAAALLLASTAIQAQQSEPAQRPNPAATPQDYAQPAATAASFSDTELKSFIQAQQKVEAIRTEISGKLSNTQDPQEVQKLQEEANVKMIAAVEATGLSRTKYNEIAQAVLSDPSLAEKLSQLQ